VRINKEITQSFKTPIKLSQTPNKQQKTPNAIQAQRPNNKQ
jgi:hypothetical protein